LKLPWRDNHLLTFLTSSEMWRYWEVFWKKNSKTASGSGTIVSRKA
jgi:hypothetical protein